MSINSRTCKTSLSLRVIEYKVITISHTQVCCHIPILVGTFVDTISYPASYPMPNLKTLKRLYCGRSTDAAETGAVIL